MITATEAWDAAVLAVLNTVTTGLFADLKAGLFTNVTTPTKQSVIADFTEPTYGGYARQDVVMGAPFRDPQNGICALGGALNWQETGSPTSVTIYGIFYTWGSSPELLGAELFPAPITLVDLLSAFSTVLQYVESNNNQGFSTIIQ